MQMIEKVFESIEKFLDKFFGKQIEFIDNFLIKAFKYRYEEPTSGIYAIFSTPEKLLEAAKKSKEKGYTGFDCFSPFPIHGLEHAMGYERSKLPYLTFFAGLTGLLLAIFIQYNAHENLISYTITHAIDAYPNLNSYPLNYGGKPTFSWPAMIPICFELTVLFGGLGTVAGLFLLSRMPKPFRYPLTESITDDKFVIWIPANSQNYNVEEIKSLFQNLGAEEIKVVG
jgi:hypothetical protein